MTGSSCSANQDNSVHSGVVSISPSCPCPALNDLDRLLHGHDETKRIVAIHAVTDRTSRRGHVHIYRRSEDGLSVKLKEEPFYPFFFLSDVKWLKGFDRSNFRYQQLDGHLHFDNLVVLSNWNEYWDALRHVERLAKSAGDTAPTYTVPSPSQQYLMQSGRTCFKGMRFDELHRLQLDIECISEREFPNADRRADRIILIALSDNRGWRKVLGTPEWPEERLLDETIRTIQEQDPDIIEGHNIFRFDFPYLMRRCAMHGVPFAIGRDRSEPRTFSTSIRFAERSLDFTALDIVGRHVIDTFFLAMTYDVIKRDLPGYGLKEVARYFGFAPADRTYVEGDKITQMWEDDPETLIKYAEDDVIETERIARHLSESNFYLTQMLPMEYGQVARVGPAAKIESLFVREYLRKKHSLPRSEWGSQTHGGYTNIFFTGVTGPIVYADVESLYPSIMLNYDICPDRDVLKIFPALLGRLTALRLDAKRAMSNADSDELKSALDARQNSYKIIINSFYGFLGFSAALFNDYSEADRVALTGQNILLSIMRLVEEKGGQIIEVDTDGVFFVPPAHVRTEEKEREFLKDLNIEMPKGIRIGFDGRYERMMSYKMKNYALMDYDGLIKMKGSSLVSRATEPFGRKYVRDSIQLLLHSSIQEMHELYLMYRDKITEHRWEHAYEFARSETLKDSLSKYQRDVESGKRSRSASYELAIKESSSNRKPIRKGDRVSFYITGTGESGPAFENARLASSWRPEMPDENVSYYHRRLNELSSKFEPFFNPPDYRAIFSQEDLFGFDASDISIRSQQYPLPADIVPPTPLPDDEEF